MIVAFAFELTTLERLSNAYKDRIEVLGQHLGCLYEISYYLNQIILSINLATFMD